MITPPRWAIGISLSFFILIGIGISITFLYQLSRIFAEPYIVLGELLFLTFIFYFLIYTPTTIMIHHFKERCQKK